MNNKSRCDFCLTVLSLAILISHSAYAQSQALKDLKIHIASVSALGYEHDLSEPVIRLWDDTTHLYLDRSSAAGYQQR